MVQYESTNGAIFMGFSLANRENIFTTDKTKSRLRENEQKSRTAA